MSVRVSILMFAAGLLLTACSIRPPNILEPVDSAPAHRLDPNRIADATPRDEPRSSRGNPASYKVFGRRYHVMRSSQGYRERGIASWYGTKFHGRSTSSGEPYNMYAMTAAHKSLPLPTYVQVTNLRNGRRAVVKVNDRGPFHDNRLIDLSYAAATKLGILGQGTGLVEVVAIDPRAPQPASTRQASTRLQPLSDPNLFLQVGAFSSRHNAYRMRTRLERSLNRAIRIQQADKGGIPVFRVQVGPLKSVETADDLSLRLARIGIEETHIVIE